MRARRGIPTFAGLLALALCVRTAAAAPEIVRVRHWSSPDHTRIVLDLTSPCRYEVRTVRNPDRLAINLFGAEFFDTAPVAVDDGLVSRIRCNPGTRRAQVVVDLERAAPFTHFMLPAAQGRPDRIVVDISRDPTRPERRAAAGAPRPGAAPSAPPTVATATPEIFTVILDPGHGGMDPGAIRSRVEEKDVVLAVAREAARMFDALPGYRAVLTRDRDYFLSLGRRVEIAQEKKGDLFLSLHCNTHPKSTVAGMEVYFLSLEGASDREARELADAENAADLVGLPPEERGNESVLSILMDLRMTRVLDHSSRLADHLLRTASHTGVVRSRKVKQGDFLVLRSLAMPSVLVEMAYLSNEGDRRMLTSGDGVEKMAATLVAAVLGYRGDRENLASLMPGPRWTHRHRVRPGDTLWDLARRHHTTINAIREHNQLSSSSLLIGQTLTLPALD